MMRDLDISHDDQNRSSHSTQATSPALYLPQLGDVAFPPAGHPDTPSYMSMPVPNVAASPPAFQLPFPQHYSQQQLSVQEAVPRSLYQIAPQAPQIIVIKESCRRHHDSRHRTHFHSAEPVIASQSFTSSTSDTPTKAEYLESRQYTDQHSHQHSSPRYHSDSHHHSGSYHPSRHHPHHYSGSYHPTSYRPDSDHSTNRRSDGSMSHIKYRLQQSPLPHSAVTSVYQPDGEFLYSKCTGRKKALCIGINYRGQSHELRGCINDAHSVRKWLMKCHGFKSEDIVLLADDTSEPRYLPTRENMLNAMKWLVRSAKIHDSLFLHYSGHGGQVKDQDGDEAGGFDEVIFPLDYKKEGVILDDDLHDIMVSPLPAGCRLTALFDSCHSGTVLDLPYILTCDGLRQNNIASDWIQKKASCADVISWSACKDGETSVDTFQDGVAVGAMSNAFISALKERPNQSYQELLYSVRAIVGPKYGQTPQLGSSHLKDMSHRFIV